MAAIKRQFGDLGAGGGVEATLFQRPNDRRVGQLLGQDLGPGAERIAHQVPERCLVVVVVRAMDIEEFALAEELIVQSHVALVAADLLRAGVEHLQAEAAVIAQGVFLGLHGPAGVVVGDEISAGPGRINKPLDVFPAVFPGAKVALVLPLMLGHFQRHILAEIGVPADDGGVVRILCQQVEVNFRLEQVKLAGGRGADIGLIARQHEEIVRGKGRVVIGSLVVRDGQDGVAFFLIGLYHLFRRQGAVRKVGVGVQVGAVLLRARGNVREHGMCLLYCFVPERQKGSRRGLPFSGCVEEFTSLRPWSSPSSYISGK